MSYTFTIYVLLLRFSVISIGHWNYNILLCDSSHTRQYASCGRVHYEFHIVPSAPSQSEHRCRQRQVTHERASPPQPVHSPRSVSAPGPSSTTLATTPRGARREEHLVRRTCPPPHRALTAPSPRPHRPLTASRAPPHRLSRPPPTLQPSLQPRACRLQCRLQSRRSRRGAPPM